MTTDNRMNEQTPNPTAEQIVREVLRHAVVASGETLEQWTGAVASELRAHGLLSEGTPTEAQVEAAAVASINSHRSRAGLPTLATLDGVPNADEWREDSRAALVAAQGAAPQAESVPKSSYISPQLPAQIRGLYRADLREKSIQTMLDLAGDLIQELIDLRAAPVLPSSGVDDALGMIDRTLDSISEFGTTWQHHEVVRMLNDIRGALAGKDKNDE